MKTPSVVLACGLAFLAASGAFAGSRQSANYQIVTDSIDAGGRRTASANYTNDSSLGGAATASSAGGAVLQKSGYLGQLFEVSGLVISSTTHEINEGGALQLAAWQLLDDATFLGVPATSVAWSVGTGPLASISASGVATARIVYQDTPALARGAFGALSGSVGLTVKNRSIDDFGSYAGDGLDDAWQVQYFGLENPLAGPQRDANGTGQNNLFKYVAGLNPIASPCDPDARFQLEAEAVPGLPGQRLLRFRPIVEGRTYVVQFLPDLATSGGGSGWQPLTNFTQPPDSGATRTVTDLQAVDAKRVYRVQITR